MTRKGPRKFIDVSPAGWLLPGGNDLGFQGAIALAPGLQLGALRQLTLRECKLGDGGVGALAEARLISCAFLVLSFPPGRCHGSSQDLQENVPL